MVETLTNSIPLRDSGSNQRQISMESRESLSNKTVSRTALSNWRGKLIRNRLTGQARPNFRNPVLALNLTGTWISPWILLWQWRSRWLSRRAWANRGIRVSEPRKVGERAPPKLSALNPKDLALVLANLRFVNSQIWLTWKYLGKLSILRVRA